jgi:hypothetical protein
VQIPAGKHQIHLAYEDRAFEIGAAISVCLWVNCLICLPLMRRRPASGPSTVSGPDTIL